MNMLRRASALIAFGALGLGLLGASEGCTASASAGGTVSGSSCATDSTVTNCSSGTGYSCTSSDTPDQSNSALICSDGVAGNAGSTLYCCFTGSTSDTTCGSDSTVSCPGGGFGFSCSNATEPPTQAYPSLNCSTGASGNAGSETYCCTDGTSSTGSSSGTTGSNSTCAPDSTVTNCTQGAGYSCTGSDTPDQSDSSLLCSDGVAGNAGSTTYCCLTSSSDTTCGADNTVSCPNGSFGFSCSNASEPPTQAYPSLNCGSGTAGNAGSETYCCTD
jgi:hypothetical protein